MKNQRRVALFSEYYDKTQITWNTLQSNHDYLIKNQVDLPKEYLSKSTSAKNIVQHIKAFAEDLFPDISERQKSSNK